MTLAIEINQIELTLSPPAQKKVHFSLPELSVKKTEMLALVGSSGCGKSTLLNLIGGLLKADSGRISILGTEMNQLTISQLDAFRGNRIGFIYQQFNLLNAFTALENVMLGLRFGRKIQRLTQKKRAKDLLRRVGLEQRMHEFPARLSVGECQRVAIARALANNADLILADEPTGSLDPHTANEIFDLLLEVCRESNCTLLFVTHDHQLAKKLHRQFDCESLIGYENE